MSVCVISQPRFFLGLHYLHRMMVADLFVILDTVRFNPRHEENRAKLRGAAGAQWLTVPMRQAHREQLIRETHADPGQPWAPKALQTLQHLYGRAPHYRAHAPTVQEVLERPPACLTELARASWGPALRLLGITCRFVLASELPVSGQGARLLLDICKHLGADTYLSGMFGREYLDGAEFVREGVALTFHEYQYCPYPQRYDGFVPFLSYLDALFNTELDRDLVLAGGTAGDPFEKGAQRCPGLERGA